MSLKKILNKKIDLPKLPVWSYLVFCLFLFFLGFCASCHNQLTQPPKNKKKIESEVKQIALAKVKKNPIISYSEKYDPQEFKSKKTSSLSFKFQGSNQSKFFSQYYEWIEKAECGPFKPPCCHLNKQDAGGYTCNGMSMRHNQNVFSKCITIAYHPKGFAEYDKKTTGYTSLVNNIRKCFSDAYYKKYFKKFELCPPPMALRLLDFNILTGKGAKTFQRAYGLKQDNIFGKNSVKKCQEDLDPSKFIQTKIKMLRSFRDAKHFCTAWISRVMDLEVFLGLEKKEKIDNIKKECWSLKRSKNDTVGELKRCDCLIKKYKK